jgi:hypothetical protein
MSVVEFSILSAVIGLVLFGSAMALGFQASTSFTAIAAAADASGTSSPPSPALAESLVTSREPTPGTAAPRPPRESTGTTVGTRNYVSSGNAWSGVDRVIDDATGGAAKAARQVGGKPSLAALGGAGDGNGGAPSRAARYGGVPAAAAGPDFGLPLSTQATPADRIAFESSRDAQEADGRPAEILLDYPIPPIVPNSDLGLGKDPFLVAALAVAHGERSADDGRVGMVYAAYSGEGAAEPMPASSVTGLWAGAAVASLGLSDEDLMLLSMVAGMIGIATALWLASCWLTDRASLKRQKIWEREKSQALEADAEGPDAGAAKAAA